ncbi:DNA segregation ATPase FtsK/SpoIIIE, S-DNA-T family [Pseudonocardia ammonioxydans]|uniref:DNA segregation ATPase FtsK/SpoIIIE, S-DNA-T family n=1 Tax=Pseudonocardia ammonioxydans TaxID=260086 RepID=A0A1I5GNX2_PSUAM|nr:FtsK/SpoIIIE domain-containing protein [Pseudonocardia ammonioxydans]SFO37774.1 DNA segregation ATPase FtsK/SpoIIIE, S-DNA-T family [Pseudonocardia ammonioxydans]
MTTTGTLFLLGAGGAVLLFLLHRLGQVLGRVLEALAAVAVVFVTLWLACKGTAIAVIWLVRHWRTTLTTAGVGVWCWLLGWPSLAITAATAGLSLGLWRLASVPTFDRLAGRRLRAWWLRWALYAPRLPRWMRACQLTVPDPAAPVVVQVNPLARTSSSPPPQRPRRDQTPRVLGVRSGPSWDEVRVRLVPGQTPESFDEATRALAVARGVTRCQVRELAPNVVSIDFQRRNLLAGISPAPEVADLAGVDGASVDLRRVWSGRTEYGTDWHQSLIGGHTLVAGATGAGKGSLMWAPLLSIAPAIRDGLVRVNGIDPKGMELAYGRRLFHRYTVTSRDTLDMLDELVESMEARKREHAGSVRAVAITRDTPLELVEFDEIGALIRYVGDRKTREAITERIALLTTQGRALGFTVRGYVQEPTKDTVPVRELFPRRVCLRVASKSHVGMVLGEHAYDRGAWANRIGESEAGVGYLFGEGVREPLRVRAAWVSDEAIKALENYIAGTLPSAVPAPVLALPAPAEHEAGGAA